MPETEKNSHDTQPPPPTNHPLPRRTSPANSITLRHHRLARDASLRASPGSAAPADKSNLTSPPRRNSSGDSHETGQSDAKKWFDQSNQNPTATFDNNVMDVDPPFFQKESDSSNEDRPYPYQQHPPPRLNAAQSSSADDYRSVIDDLTVEIQKLKEELKRYKQKGPEMLRKEKLFEIKIHGLPKRKRRELEATLRDFTASLGDSPDASSSQRKKSSRHATRDHMYSGSGSISKHASSSSGSNARPVDSAYASMSTGANSSGTSLGRPPMSYRAKSSQEKIESYLRDIPEGLYPRHVAMTEKEKKRLVVRRLEQLFTGKIGGRGRRNQAMTPKTPAAPAPALALAPVPAPAPAPVVTEGQSRQSRPVTHQPPTLVGGAAAEPLREARILPPEQQSGHSGKKSRSRDNGSASNSNEDQTESGGNGNSSGSGVNTSPSNPPPPEQRPTRPTDLDPDRVQVPSENMEYIRHLGLVPPELLAESAKAHDVHPDADGWVYLNLLCNLAQLHIINVTPDFVRLAVSEISTKFQLSPDGRKIRWRGGLEGTRFSSDSSGDNSQKSPDTEDTDSPNKDGQFKRQKTGHSRSDELQSSSSGKHPSKFGPQISASSESFHYKPLFVQQDSAGTQRSLDDTLSSLDPAAAEESNMEDSRWGQSGSGTSYRRKRRHDGAIIYYSGAPFCTDLSGDPGDVSPTTYMLSSGQDGRGAQGSSPLSQRPILSRSGSGSLLSHKPLNERDENAASNSKMDIDTGDSTPELTTDSSDDADEGAWEFPWGEGQQSLRFQPLEPCGIGGVIPDDHFVVIVTTKRPKHERRPSVHSIRRSSGDETTDVIISRLASLRTSSPMPFSSASSLNGDPAVEVEYVSGRIKRLSPVSLPPPAMFFPPFSTDTSGSNDESFGSEDDEDEPETSEEFMSRRANPHQSDDYPDGVDLSSGDEDGEDPDDEADQRQAYAREMDSIKQKLPERRRRPSLRATGSVGAAAGAVGRRSKSASADAMHQTGGSSAATAGAVASGYSSSAEAS